MAVVEFDSRKDRLNRAKHGISLALAEEFSWDTAKVKQDTRHDYGERRYTATGLLGGRLHVLVFTSRSGAIRVIGLRRANARERRIYAQEKETGAH